MDSKWVNPKIIPLRLPASIHHVAFITELIWNMLSNSLDIAGDTMAGVAAVWGMAGWEICHLSVGYGGAFELGNAYYGGRQT